MKKKFIIELDLPTGVSVADMKAYIEEAVRADKGQLHPDHPIRGLDGNSVVCKSYRKPRL